MKKLPSLYDLYEMVLEATGPIKANFRGPLEEDEDVIKSDSTIQTKTDRVVNDNMMSLVSDKFAGIGFIGEEGDNYNGEEYFFLLDPLDGSEGYKAGSGNPGVPFSLIKKGPNDHCEAVLAVIHDPLNGMTWLADKNSQTTLIIHSNRTTNTRKVRVSNADPSRIVISTWSGDRFSLDKLRNRIMTSKDMTSLSFESIAIPGAMVAQGRCQATVFPGDSAIETIATKLAVERAGGYTTDLMDRPLGKFELVERRGKYDLDLSCGAIMSANDELPCMISRMINRAAYC